MSVSVTRQWPRLAAMRRSGDVDGLLAELDNPAEFEGGAFGRSHLLTVRERAIQELARIGDHRAVQPIVRMLKDPADGVRADAARALGKLGDQTAVPALIESLGDRSDDVRAWSATSLGLLGDRRAIPDLISTLEAENFYVRINAARALGQIGDPRGVGPLKEAVRRESFRHPAYRWRMAKTSRFLRQKARTAG